MTTYPKVVINTNMRHRFIRKSIKTFISILQREKFDFVEMRNRRDATLSMPKLILPAIQINMFAGKFPQPEGQWYSLLKNSAELFLKYKISKT